MSDKSEANESDLRFGATISDALEALEADGFNGSFRVSAPDAVECLSCHEESPPQEVHLEAMWRIEGVSDPDDEESVMGIVCPRCDAKGTLILNYGSQASAEEAEVFVQMADHRATHRAATGGT